MVAEFLLLVKSHMSIEREIYFELLNELIEPIIAIAVIKYSLTGQYLLELSNI